MRDESIPAPSRDKYPGSGQANRPGSLDSLSPAALSGAKGAFYGLFFFAFMALFSVFMACFLPLCPFFCLASSCWVLLLALHSPRTHPKLWEGLDVPGWPREQVAHGVSLLSLSPKMWPGRGQGLSKQPALATGTLMDKNATPHGRARQVRGHPRANGSSDCQIPPQILARGAVFVFPKRMRSRSGRAGAGSSGTQRLLRSTRGCP